MKNTSLALTLGALAALTAGPAQAQEKAKVAAPATPPSAGLFNDYLRGQSDAFKAWLNFSQTVPRFPAGQIVNMGCARELSAHSCFGASSPPT